MLNSSPDLQLQRAWWVIGWTMLHYLWIGGSIGLFAAAGRLWLRASGPDLRHGFSLACLVVLAIAPVGIAVRLWDENPIAGPTRAADALQTEPVEAPSTIAPTPLTTPADLTLPGDPSTALAPWPADPIGEGLRRVVGWLPWLWLSGTPILLALLGTGLIGAQRLRRDCRPIETGRWPGLVQDLAWSLGVSPKVGLAVCERLAAPVLLGIVRPVILLPPAALSGWSVEQLQMVLLHELAHVRRRDNLVNLLQRIIESLLFYQPAVWIVSRWVRLDREQCCDRIVVEATNRPRAYAEALASMALPGLSTRYGVLAMADAPLVDRIRRILVVKDHAAGLSREVLAILAMILLAPWLALVLTGLTPHFVPHGSLALSRGSPTSWPARYGWESGERSSYTVHIEARGPDLLEAYQGTSTYRVLWAADEGASLEQTSMLFPSLRTLDGRPVPSFSAWGIASRSPTVHHLGRLGPLVRSIRVDSRGRLLSTGGPTELPYALGDLSGKALVPLPEDGRTRWTTTESRTLRVIDDRPAADPEGSGSVRVRALVAVEVSTYTLGRATTDTLPILRDWTLQTEPSAGSAPELHLSGRDQIQFDLRRGLVRSLESSATLRITRQGEAREFPLSLSIQLEDGSTTSGEPDPTLGS
ncbi:hypothetical protein BH23PLA1_BH23PLA1_13980 [soil metagenome]